MRASPARSCTASGCSLDEADASAPLHELVNGLLLSPMGRRDWPLRFYSRELLFSVEARRNFVDAGRGGISMSGKAVEDAVTRRFDRGDRPAASRRREDGLPIPRRYWSAAAIWLALAMAVLDGAIANVALADHRPRSRRVGGDLGVDRQFLSADDHRAAVAAGGARRPARLPPHLHPRPGAVHARLARRARSPHSLADLILARIFQGAGRGGHHEHEPGAGTRDLSGEDARARALAIMRWSCRFRPRPGRRWRRSSSASRSWPWLFLINLPVGVAAILVSIRVDSRMPAGTATGRLGLGAAQHGDDGLHRVRGRDRRAATSGVIGGALVADRPRQPAPCSSGASGAIRRRCSRSTFCESASSACRSRRRRSRSRRRCWRS